MRQKSLFLITLSVAMLSLLSSCSPVNGAQTKSQAVSVGAVSEAGTDSSASAGASLKISIAEKSKAADSPAPEIVTDITEEASDYGSSPGRVALAIIINRLDNATVVEDLAQQDAPELFELLRQTASQNSQTLQSLDKQYYLSDILASEGIHVTIESNNVISSASGSPDKDWIAKFEKALKSAD